MYVISNGGLVEDQSLKSCSHGAFKCETTDKPDASELRSRVARWHIFEPKVPIWVNFGRT
jgi:hypothetical protein